MHLLKQSFTNTENKEEHPLLKAHRLVDTQTLVIDSNLY